MKNSPVQHGVIRELCLRQYFNARGLVCLAIHFSSILAHLCICPFSDGLLISAAPRAPTQAPGMHIFFFT